MDDQEEAENEDGDFIERVKRTGDDADPGIPQLQPLECVEKPALISRIASKDVLFQRCSFHGFNIADCCNGHGACFRPVFSECEIGIFLHSQVCFNNGGIDSRCDHHQQPQPGAVEHRENEVKQQQYNGRRHRNETTAYELSDAGVRLHATGNVGCIPLAVKTLG